MRAQYLEREYRDLKCKREHSEERIMKILTPVSVSNEDCGLKFNFLTVTSDRTHSNSNEKQVESKKTEEAGIAELKKQLGDLTEMFSQQQQSLDILREMLKETEAKNKGLGEAIVEKGPDFSIVEDNCYKRFLDNLSNDDEFSELLSVELVPHVDTPPVSRELIKWPIFTPRFAEIIIERHQIFPYYC